ncbi:FtsK/SpoIIIE domain-containing protein [Nesterenkonia sp.]|uniref:FtsK/SpoIIIE domain-containing protein n=1 Tax=Nesterenkonia sp. TaxID=704201 RepID=UPI00261DB566|nr:FtsK/SpoIIIE domain-containing protein [Nesterenkonia sp.]
MPHLITGRQLAAAVRGWVETVLGAECPQLQLSVDGRLLHELPAGSELIHPGMVVLLSRPGAELNPLRSPGLSLCVEAGPDSGRLIPLRRGRCTIGRGRTDVPIADAALSRQEALLDVGVREVRLRKDAQDPGCEITAGEALERGDSVLRLSLEAPDPHLPGAWPPEEVSVGEREPEARHTMMLAFAFVPLAAGIVLVVVTGMWFFLLFSAASALVASAIFLQGRRRRVRYRRAVAQAASEWAAANDQVLPSPGRAAELLRSGSANVTLGSSAAEHPAVRAGRGRLQALVDASSAGRETEVETAAGLDLTAAEVTLICGPDRETHRLLRWILLQLLLSPVPTHITVLSREDDGLWIPELRDAHRCHLRLASEQIGDPPVAGSAVLISSRPLEQTETERLRRSGWHLILPGAGPARGAGMPGWSIDLAERRIRRRTAAAETSDLDRPEAEALRFDGLSVSTFRQLSRLALRHLRQGALSSQLPDHAAQPLQGPLLCGSAVNSLLAVLGPGRTGGQQLDLVEDGPHTLIAGTTGSGKSELLKTILLSMCARYGPEELALVLIDFKGGAAFHQMAELEHVLGVVTDLSQAAAERTLEGIRSELTRRERLFLAAGAGDYGEYRRKPGSDPLPRMLVVIDEFRIFAHELPDQLDELMRLATLGRSLGLHLVLSTQRPQGVVTADIRANIGASIALRMRSEDESRDVIGEPTAASISRRLPGRALLRRPGEPVTEFQTALLQAAKAPLRLAPKFPTGSSQHRSADAPGASGSDAQSPHSEHGPLTHTGQIVAMLREELDRRGQRRRHTPLLPPLPDHLEAHEELTPMPGTVLLGRIDDPAAQQQRDLRLDPAEPQCWAFIGEAPASGSAAAAAAAAQFMAAFQAREEADVYLFDGDRSLAGLADHPRVGAWLTEEDAAEAAHCLRQLCQELSRRRLDPGCAGRPLLLVVTGYSQWAALAQSSAAAGWEHDLGTLAAEGPQGGISVLLSGGRELAVGRLAGRIPHKVYLPFASSQEVTYLWPQLRTCEPLPGRGVLISPSVGSPGLTVQLVTSAPPPAADPDAAAPLLRVRPLPGLLPVAELPRTPQAGGGAVVGVQQFDWSPAVYTPGPANLILGSPGTGKSTCLQLLAARLQNTALVRGGTGQIGALEQRPDHLLIDDAHRCTDQEHAQIEQALAQGVRVVASAVPQPAVLTQLPWAHRARAQGSNVLLSPVSRSEGEALGVVVPVLEQPVPGRAVHLRPGGPVLVQWALPDHRQNTAAGADQNRWAQQPKPAAGTETGRRAA